MKQFIVGLILVSCILLLGYVPVGNYQHELAGQVLRFHVIANSDTLADQQLKLKVRDGVINYLTETIKSCDTQEDCKKVIDRHLPEITKEVLEVIEKSGYAYNAAARLSKKYFPEKEYGDMTFPRGYYDALTIEIGSGSGRNWWCVLFPNLCFSDAVTAKVSDESKALLEEQLSENAYYALLQGENVQIRFKLAQIIAELFSE